MYVTTNNENEVTNLNESKKVYIGGFGRKGESIQSQGQTTRDKTAFSHRSI